MFRPLLVRGQFASATDDLLPLERGAGVHLVSLHVVMAQHALVSTQFLIRQFLAHQCARGIAGVIAAQFRKHFAERGGEMGKRAVLFGREIVLFELLALDLP